MKQSCLRLFEIIGLAVTLADLTAAPAETNAPIQTNVAAEITAPAPQGDAAAPVLPAQASDDRVEILDNATRTNGPTQLRSMEMANQFQLLLDSARKQRAAKELTRAEASLIHLLESRAPEEIKRPALLDLALVMQEEKSYAKAQRLLSEYVRRYPKDAGVPEVLLRQAYLYREMGVSELALSKFFAVMSSCLNLHVDELEYYQKLVLRAQVEIAETYYSLGKFKDAAEYLNKVLKLESLEVNRADIMYKLVRCYWNLQDYNRATASSRLYLDKFPDALDTPETRFLLADSLKKLGHDKDAVKEILALLQKQQENSKSDPKQWLYWQQRAGNDIANQFYQQGDFFSALQIYESLAQLSESPGWRVPVLYQIGLVYENLKQLPKAAETYEKIIEWHKNAPAGNLEDSRVSAVVDMARWRKQFIGWESKAEIANKQLEPPQKPDEATSMPTTGS